MQKRTRSNPVAGSRGLAFAVAMTLATLACGGGGTSPDARPASSVPVSSSTTSSTVPKAGSSGCGEAPNPETTVEVEQAIQSGGVARTFLLKVPANDDPDAAAPLVFNFHGGSSTGAQQSLYSGLTKVGDERGLIVVTPDALNGGWQVPSVDQSTVDVEFVKDLLAHISSAHCVDLNRVFATGFSPGALLTAEVACALPGTFGAIGLVAVELKPARCRPIAVTAFHGTEDANVPYEPGGTLPEGHENKGTLAFMADWAELDSCRTEPTVEKRDPDVEHRTYPECAGDAQVELYTIVGGGHTWPGSEIKAPALGSTTDTIDANDLLIRFFLRHPRHSD
jgi:polyhydroxybutyrate depolymerase